MGRPQIRRGDKKRENEDKEAVRAYSKYSQFCAKKMLVRVISYTFTGPRIPGAGQQIYRLVTTLVDPFLYTAKELPVLYHEHWHVELVLDEADTHLRLLARTLRSLTPDGVIQELYALLVAHTLLRTLMVRATQPIEVAPHRISFTNTLRLVDDSLRALSVVSVSRREQMVCALLKEIGTFLLPKQRLRVQARVVK